MSFDVNTPIHIQFKGLNQRLKSSIIGIDPGNFLIIRKPKSCSLDLERLAVAGADVVVRYLHRGSVYGFQSSIIHVGEQPVPLFFIRFPDRVEDHNLRSYKRIDCYLPARMEIGKMVFPGAVIDISRGGCRVVTDRRKLSGIDRLPTVGQEASIQLMLPGIPDAMPLSGVIKNLTEDDQAIKNGVEFSDMSGKVKVVIYGFLAGAGA
ncbi:MAG: flagellar brake protein [Deltaproteobacteria bacterium]|nr:flagellar brake protein [Candidatus Anaeroferrophillacea bacterium]